MTWRFETVSGTHTKLSRAGLVRVNTEQPDAPSQLSDTLSGEHTLFANLMKPNIYSFTTSTFRKAAYFLSHISH